MTINSEILDIYRIQEALESPRFNVVPGLNTAEKLAMFHISGLKPEDALWKQMIELGWTPPWQPIETAPLDGTEVLLRSPAYSEDEFSVDTGCYRIDANDDPDNPKWGLMWLDNSYDDFSCGLASNPLRPTHWKPIV